MPNEPVVSEADSEHHIPAASLFDTLADELGAVAGRIERESALKVGAFIAELARRDAERQLAFNELTQQVREKLASLKDGKDGRDGIDGKNGDAGERGLPGPAGERGEPGEKGERGERGLEGAVGLRGEPGERGEKGEKGEPGIAGPRGEKGEQGLTGQGMVGERGPPGEKGDKGDPGERGEKGEPGLTVKGERGDVGPKGDKGDPGESIVGPVGPAGMRGEKGDAGERGLAGPSGQDGKDGQSITGPQGERGERGPEGPSGKLPVRKIYVAGDAYLESEVVTHEGSLYQALRNTGRAPPHADWAPLAERGRDGKDGRSLRIRKGVYDPKNKFEYLDVVTKDSAWYVALKDNPGPCPGDDWQQGVKGRRGEPGERGPIGPKGDKGEDGREPIELLVDDSDYTLTIVLSDGTQLKRSVRELFEPFEVR